MAVSIDSYITLTDAIVLAVAQLVDHSQAVRRERAGRGDRFSVVQDTACQRRSCAPPKSASSIFYRFSTVPRKPGTCERYRR